MKGSEIGHLEGRDVKAGMGAEQLVTDQDGNHGGDTHHQQCPRADRDQQQLKGKGNASQRRIEGSGDAGAGTCSDEGNAVTSRHADDLTQGGTERRADLHDWAFASDRAATADGDS